MPRSTLLRLLLLTIALAAMVAGPMGCASADNAKKQDSAAAAEEGEAVADADAEMEAGGAAPVAPSDDDAAFEPEEPPAPPPGAALRGEDAAPQRRTPERERESRSDEAEDEGGGLFDLFDVFSKGEPAAAEEADGLSDAPAKPRAEPAPAERAGRPYPWVATRAASRVVVNPLVRTGSWGLSVSLMRDEVRPLPERVRPQDFINAPHYGYPVPKAGRWASVEVDLAPNDQGTEVMRVGLRTADSGRPVDVMFLVDATKRTPTEALDAWRDVANTAVAGLDDARDRLQVLTLTQTVAQAAATSFDTPFASVPAYPEGAASLADGLLEALRAVSVTRRDAHKALVVFTTTTAVNTMPVVRERVRLLKQRGVYVSFVSSVAARQPDADFLSLARDGGGLHIFVDEQEPAMLPSQARALQAAIAPALADLDLVFRFHLDAVQRYRLIGYQRRPRGAQLAGAPSALGRGQELTFVFEILRTGAASHDGANLGTIMARSPSGKLAPLPLVAKRHATLDDAPLSMRRAVAAASLAEWLRGAAPLIDGRQRWRDLAGDDPDLYVALDAAAKWLP